MKTIILPGEPTAQKRARIYAKGAMDPCWEAKEQHKSYINKTYPDITPATSSLFLRCIYVYEYPKSISQKKKVPQFKSTRPDRDNLDKYILDMGNGLLWEDDSLVTIGGSVKIYSDKSFTIISYRETDGKDLMETLAWIGAVGGEFL